VVFELIQEIVGKSLFQQEPFFGSPDIFVLPNQSVSSTPDVPISLGGMAEAGVPNTLFAHIWNLGRGFLLPSRRKDCHLG